MSINFTKVEWQETLIGKFEQFLIDRYRIDTIVARMMAVSLVSVALANLEDYSDEFGQINCGMSFWWLAKSSIGKSPPLTRLRMILKEYNTNIIAPTRRVTTAGLSEWVSGRKGKVSTTGTAVRDAMGPHKICFFLCDELSKYIKGINTDFGNDLMEWHSQADDKYIEGAITRAYEYEKDAEVYQVFFGAGTEYVFEKIPDAFFKQGWGNKIQFLCTQGVQVKRLRPSFFLDGGSDKEFDVLKTFVINEMHTIETYTCAYCQSSKLWIDFQFWIFEEAEATHGFDYSYLRKLPYAVLKLATIYSANIHNKEETSNVLTVDDEMMMKAIEDGLQLYKNWVKAHEWWVQEKKDGEDKEKPVLTDLERIMMWVVDVGNGYCSTTEIKAALNASNASRVIEKLDLCIDKGWLSLVCDKDALILQYKAGMMTIDLFNRLKSKHGSDPRCYKITEEGKTKYGI